MAIVTTEPFVLLLNFIYTAHISTVPQLVIKKVCNAKFNATVCDQLNHAAFKNEQVAVQESSSLWVLVLFVATLLPSMFTVLIWGPIGDKVGRKRAILVPPIFFAVQSAIYLLNSTKLYSSHVVYLVIGAVATSVFGDFQGAYAIAYSYMADITERSSRRTMRMAIIEGIMFFSGAPAGLAAGFLLQKFGFGAVFISTLLMSIFMLIYVVFLLPAPNPVVPQARKESCLEDAAAGESIEKNEEIFENCSEEERPLFCKVLNENMPLVSSIKYYLNPWNHLTKIVKVINQSSSKASLISLLLCFWFTLIAITGELYITVLFIKNRPFNLSSEEVGYYFAFISVARGVGAVVLSQVAVRFLGFGDYLMIIVGLLSQTANYVLLGFSKTKTMLYLVSLSGIGLGVATSGLRSLITKHVPFDSHGSILAAIEFLDAFGALLANVLSNSVYNGTVSTFPGAAFFVLGSFSGLAFFLIICIRFCKILGIKRNDE